MTTAADSPPYKSAFELVTAAHHFLLEAFPFSEPRVSRALSRFTVHIKQLQAPSALSRIVASDLLHIVARKLMVTCEASRGSFAGGISHNDVVEQFDECMQRLVRESGVAHPLTKMAITFVARNYSDPALTLPRTAHHVGCRPQQLCALFRRHMGTSFLGYVRKVRLQKACIALSTSSKSVKEIVADVGYKHASDFVHHFRDEFAVTPTQYRRHACLVQGECDSTPVAGGTNVVFRPNICIAIVDDDDATRDVVGKYLELLGVKIVTMANGTTFLRQASAFAFDAVLLDYRLPDIDGVECLRALRQIPACSAVPVVLFSADWEVEMRVGEWQPLKAQFVSKLCDLDHVVTVLHRAVHAPGGGF